MSVDRFRWAQLAQEARFNQLDAVRRQAETWRTGLAGVTGLFGAVLVLKGRDSVTGLANPYPALVLALLLGTLGAFVTATLSALRAASGEPGDECLLTGEDLEAWSRQEAADAQRSIQRARALTLLGAVAMAAAISLTWLAPARQGTRPTVAVQYTNGHTCGDLVTITDHTVVVQTGDTMQVIPFAQIEHFEYADRCTP